MRNYRKTKKRRPPPYALWFSTNQYPYGKIHAYTKACPKQGIFGSFIVEVLIRERLSHRKVLQK